MNRYLLAKQDLATFHKRDLDTLARYNNVSGSGDDLLWGLAYKIHTGHRGEMPPGCLNKYDIIIGDEDIPGETLVRSNGVCWDADTLVDYITKTALRNEYPADAYYMDHEDHKVPLTGKPIYDSKTLEEIYGRASPENVKRLQDFISQLGAPDVLTPEIMELVKKTGAILQARGPIFIEWITSRWPEELIKEWISKVHTQTDLEPPRGMSKELKEKLGFDKSQILGEFHEQYRDWGLQVKTQLAALDHRLKEETLYECVSGTFCMKMMGMYFLDAYNKWAVENGQAVYEWMTPDDYSALRIQYKVPEPAMEAEGFRPPFMVGDHLIEPGAELPDAELEGTELQYANLEGANLRGANLVGVNLDGANLIGTTLEDADLEGAYLGGAHLVGANLKNANFYEANLEHATLQGSNLQDATLFNTGLFVVDLSTANLIKANLEGADLEGADLTNAILKDSILKAAYLMGINMQGADLTGALLNKAILDRGDLTGATLVNTQFKKASLNQVVFTNAIITDADFSGAELIDANFANVGVTGANFTGANLIAANLRGATLTNVNFTDANLTDADFTNATFTNTTFTGADTTGTQF